MKNKQNHFCYCECFNDMVCDFCFGTETIINIDDMDFVCHGLDGETPNCNCF